MFRNNFIIIYFNFSYIFLDFMSLGIFSVFYKITLEFLLHFFLFVKIRFNFMIQGCFTSSGKIFLLRTE